MQCKNLDGSDESFLEINKGERSWYKIFERMGHNLASIQIIGIIFS